MKLDHVSHSATNMAMKCGQQYMFKYKMDLSIPPGFATIRGFAAHAAIEHNLKQKIETKVDIGEAECEQAASDDMDRQLAGEIRMDPDYAEFGFEKAKGIVKDEAITLSALHLNHVAPSIQPIAVEVEIITTESEMLPVKVTGRIDVIDDEHRVHDHKTSRKSGPKNVADTSDQLTWYELLHRARYGKPPKELVIDQLVQTAPSNKHPTGQLSVNRYATQRDDKDVLRIIGVAKQVMKMAELEIFVPAPDSAWWCSAKWCGYHPDAGGPCQYGRRERRPTT